MVSEGTGFVATFLLSMGVTLIIQAILTGWYTTRSSRARAIALAVVGIGAMVGMVYILWDATWGGAWDDVLWPILVMGAAFVSGVAACAGLVYILVGSR